VNLTHRREYLARCRRHQDIAEWAIALAALIFFAALIGWPFLWRAL